MRPNYIKYIKFSGVHATKNIYSWCHLLRFRSRKYHLPSTEILAVVSYGLSCSVWRPWLNGKIFTSFLKADLLRSPHRQLNTPFPIATRHTLQWLKAELFSWESCHTSITTRHTVIKTELFSWESCLCAKTCKQCIKITAYTFHS